VIALAVEDESAGALVVEEVQQGLPLQAQQQASLRDRQGHPWHPVVPVPSRVNESPSV
jgi:hypothetical protein